MPRYFFDLHDGVDLYDLEGTECRDLEHVRVEAKKLLPQLALDELYREGEHKTYVVSVRNDAGVIVYSANLTFKGS